MRLIKYFFLLVFTSPIFAHDSFAVNADLRYEIASPTFPITINGSPLDNVHNQYPLFLYEGITYFPMTWNNSISLGLNLEWDRTQGLKITKLPLCQPLTQNLQSELTQFTSQQVVLPPFPVIVNGKTINNSEETYPILYLNDIVYFPMTWRFTNDEFNWKTIWDSLNGYSIEACDEQMTENIRNQEELAGNRNLAISGNNNSVIGGKLATLGDWIYLNPDNNKPSLEKWSKDSNTKIKLTDDNAASINAIGEWVYYTVNSGLYVDGVLQYNGVFKIRQDGTERATLSPISASQLVVDHDWIYLLETNDSGISRMKTDGSLNEKIIQEKGIQSFYISGNQLYYNQNNYDMYQTNLFGKEKKQVDSSIFSDAVIVGGWVYHTKMTDNMSAIYKTSLNGSTTIKLYDVSVWASNGLISSLQYRDGWLYFLQGKLSIGSHIDVNKVRIDGTGYTKYSTVGYATKLYNVAPFFYVDSISPFGGGGTIHLVN